MFYIDLFSALQRHRVDYVLIGGLAISLHGIERATMDIDVTVAMTPGNLSALVSMARELGMKPVLPVELESLANLGQLAQWHRERQLEAFALRAPGHAGVTLNVLLYPPVDFSGLRERAVTFKAKDVPVAVASIDDLIALKQAVGRPIDLADIEHLKRLKAFKALPTEEKLRWQEEVSTFIRLTRESNGLANHAEENKRAQVK